MNKVLIYPVYKNGNKKEWKNWRPIALINTTLRIIDKAIARRIQEFIKETGIIPEE